jgi:hypothetical protein
VQASLLQRLAGHLLAGTFTLLKTSTNVGTHLHLQQQQQQQRFTLARLWRNCLWMSLQRYRGGEGQLENVAEKVLQMCTMLRAELP